MPVRLKNNARALLVVSISELDPVIRVQVGKGDRFPILGENEWFPLVLEDELGNMEITHAIARAGDVITVRRGREGTKARPFPAGSLVSLRLTQQANYSWFTGDDPPADDSEGDPDYGGTGLIFNGLVVNAYHNELGRGGYFHPSSGTSEGQFLMAAACYQAAAAIRDYEDDINADPDRQPLVLIGTLLGYIPGEEYEGRLTIANAIGTCTVRQTGGDQLPPGATIMVDDYTKEVVVEWPAYADIPGDPLPNGDFEEGDTGWIKGNGWSIEVAGGDNDGFGARVAVYRGYGFANLINEHFRECSPGMYVTARVNVQQGASSAGHCGAGIGLKFYDAEQEEIGSVEGNQIWSGSKGRWHWSVVSTRVPEGAAYMRAYVIGGRKRGYQPLWVDDASWDVPDTVGTLSDAGFDLELEVEDMSGQTATWSGRIELRSARKITWDVNTQTPGTELVPLPISTGDDGTWVEVVDESGISPFSVRNIRVGFWLSDGDWYWESISQHAIYNSVHSWAVVGVANYGWSNALGAWIGGYENSGSALFWYDPSGSLYYNGIHVELMETWEYITPVRIRHRLQVNGSTAKYMVALEDGDWIETIPEFTGGPFTIGASIRGFSWGVNPSESPHYGYARLISLEEDFAYPVPEGATPLSEV